MKLIQSRSTMEFAYLKGENYEIYIKNYFFSNDLYKHY